MLTVYNKHALSQHQFPLYLHLQRKETWTEQVVDIPVAAIETAWNITVHANIIADEIICQNQMHL